MTLVDILVAGIADPTRDELVKCQNVSRYDAGPPGHIGTIVMLPWVNSQRDPEEMRVAESLASVSPVNQMSIRCVGLPFVRRNRLT